MLIGAAYVAPLYKVSAMRTDKDVHRSALHFINVTDLVREPSAEHSQKASEEYNELHNWLKNEHKIRWSIDQVPEEYFTYVYKMLAGRLADTIAVSETFYNKAAAASQQSEKRLIRVLAKPPRKTVKVPLV